jgi:hypothetical protein
MFLEGVLYKWDLMLEKQQIRDTLFLISSDFPLAEKTPWTKPRGFCQPTASSTYPISTYGSQKPAGFLRSR